MMNYDSKLGDWFKEVGKRAEEFKAKKQSSPTEDAPTQAAEVAQRQQTPIDTIPARVEPTAQVARVVETTAEFEEGTSVAVAIQERTPEEPHRQTQQFDTLPGLFDENDAPQIEDFVTFLNKSLERELNTEEHPEPAAFADKGLLRLPEGTGDPRPIPSNQEQEEIASAPIIAEIVARELVAKSKPHIPDTTSTRQVIAPVEEEVDEEEKFGRLPQQLQSLLESAGDEVAQHSYTTFKESRASLIQRLLDPPITLEEAARILDVCPTTVRRYTNRGVLKHFRTAGNQRRFKLSEVLAFMENNLHGGRQLSDS